MKQIKPHKSKRHRAIIHAQRMARRQFEDGVGAPIRMIDVMSSIAAIVGSMTGGGRFKNHSRRVSKLQRRQRKANR